MRHGWLDAIGGELPSYAAFGTTAIGAVLMLL